MLYERKIRYLDYLSNGERIQGGGFVKLEVKNGSLQMDLNVMGLYRTDSLERDVLLCAEGREKSIGRIMISNGRGQYRLLCHDLSDIESTGISYEELHGIRIPLGADREVSGRWEQRRGSARENTEFAGREFLGDRRDSTKERMEKAVAGENGGEGLSETETGKEAAEMGKEARRKESSRVNQEGSGAQEEGREISSKEAIELPSEGRKKPPGARTVNLPEEEIKTISEKGAMAQPGEEIKKIPNRGIRESPDRRIKEPTDGGIQEISDKRIREAASAEMQKLSDKDVQASSRMVRETPGGRERETSDRRTLSRRAAEEFQGRAGQNLGERQKSAAGKSIRLLDDKWQQLCAIYPHIHPFQDEREYLSIGPADFVLFPSGSYKMVNNSFLLHGYYNYNHLLLGKLEKKGETSYYIGVPGSYFEKEKQVAIMFGFESFECAEEPAQPGDFGYYMMRVQL